MMILIITYIILIWWFFEYQLNLYKTSPAAKSDVVFILDVSKSMNALDYGDKTRLDVGKNLIRNYIEKHPNNRYGLEIFAWDAVAVLPLMDDTSIFLNHLEVVDESFIINGWSDFEQAIELWISRFVDPDTAGAIVLISDFEATGEQENIWWFSQKFSGYALTLYQKNIALYLIWVWESKWNKIFVSNDLFWYPIYHKDRFWKEVVTAFDQNFFDKIAEVFSAKKLQITPPNIPQNIVLKDIPTYDDVNERVVWVLISRYVMMIAFVWFVLFLWLFYYFDRVWRKD